MRELPERWERVGVWLRGRRVRVPVPRYHSSSHCIRCACEFRTPQGRWQHQWRRHPDPEVMAPRTQAEWDAVWEAGQAAHGAGRLFSLLLGGK